MVFELSSVVLSTFIGMFGVVIGAIISNYFNQKIARQSAIKDLIFKKRVEYFEKLLECAEKNIELYKNSIRELEKNSDKKSINKIISKMKKDRRKFEKMNSQLYLDIKKISAMIKSFVETEKSIFFNLEQFENFPDKKKKIYELNICLLKLEKITDGLIIIIRKKLIE